MLSKKALSITPYTAGEQPTVKVIKLNTNENPFPPSKKVEEAVKGYDFSRLRLYPELRSGLIREAIARAEGVDVSRVFVGNGSDEVLSFAFRAFYDDGKDELPVKFFDISYSFYPVFCDLYGIPYSMVEVENDLSGDINKLVGGQGAVIANPNAPTSLLTSLSDIECLLTAIPDRAVIVDEAYIDFAGEGASAVGLVEKHQNLAVVKTFSKSYSLAGIRLGYMIASEKLIEGVERIRDSFNSYPVDSLASVAGKAAIEDVEYHSACIDEVVRVREMTIKRLDELGYAPLKSAANFIFAKGGKRIYQKLREKGILVRYWDKPKLSDYVRITVGTAEEMDALLKVFEQDSKKRV